MKFEPLTRVVYVTPKKDQVFTFIKEVYDQEGLYVLDFEDVQVKENQLRLNTHPVFSVPHGMSKDYIKSYHLDRLVDQVVSYMVAHHAHDDLKIYREMNTIYLETAFNKPETLEDKRLFDIEVDSFNKIIGQVNTAVKSRFNTKVEVVLKFPFQRHQLHSVRL
ncbi:hypothetical protein SAMN05421820_101485 [Pedobacter steynii]|uniref:Uncharacterized protein n=1 Tax=Pedobacter steynii TaxID=430522 RepID=A0A1G9K7L2_9SPHI|nr:hypothetical protein [Pedobacter steynii]NQX38464.1 hypothetical protein [Pedobacter steynii]SDL45365.1 hypothetical protein SAMN05421820_101485 [Pedobacter steynii]